MRSIHAHWNACFSCTYCGTEKKKKKDNKPAGVGKLRSFAKEGQNLGCAELLQNTLIDRLKVRDICLSFSCCILTHKCESKTRGLFKVRSYTEEQKEILNLAQALMVNI